MGIVDKAKDMLGSQSDKVDQGIDKAGDLADKATGNKYQDKVDTAQDKAKDALHSMSNENQRRDDTNPPTYQRPDNTNPPA